MSEIEVQPVTDEVEAAAVADVLAAVGTEQAVPFAHPAAIKPTKRPRVAKPVAASPAAPSPIAGPTVMPTIPDLPTAAVPADTFTKEADTMDTMTNDTVNAAHAMNSDMQNKATAMFADVNDRAKGAMEKSTKMVEEVSTFGKENVEALVESSRIAIKGLETMSQDAADYARRSMETATASMRSLSGVKSPTEFMKLQSDILRQSFDAMVAQTSRSTESMLKLAGEIAQPISNRAAVAADKLKTAA